MEAGEISLAVAAAVATAAELGLNVEDAAVLHNSNRIAVRLLPCETLARVAPIAAPSNASFEVEVAQRLAETDAPFSDLDPRVEPRVYERDGHAITLWTYHEPDLSYPVTPRDYADALNRLHNAMRPVDVAAPHFLDRVAEALRLVDNPAHSPDLSAEDRELLGNALRSLSRTIVDRSANEQLIHGEPHAGNVLRTKRGLLFTDLQTTCRGPIEFDLAHCSPFELAPHDAWYLDTAIPEAVAADYPRADLNLVRMCWMLMLAMVAAWRWDRRDQFPNGRRMGMEFTNELRNALDRFGIDIDH